jgi:hypothetical protein
MIAYKGFTKDLTCTFGKGIFQYAPGQTIKESRSKCTSAGPHCAEYPLDCLKWYPPGRGSRYFEVEAAGSIDECEEDTRIACTQLTLIRELTVFQLAAKAMMYIVEHPLREWEVCCENLMTARDRAWTRTEYDVAIARGRRPLVKGVSGSVLGLLCEDDEGRIKDAKAFKVGGKIKPGIWYTLENRELREAEE